ELLSKGEVVRGFLGVALEEVPPGLERRLGVGETGGVLVSLVGKNSPAEEAGLRRGDPIMRHNKEPNGTLNPITPPGQRIAKTPPGTTVPIEILRQGERQIIDVTIVKRPIKL